MQSTGCALPNLQSISNRPLGTLRARFEATKPAASDRATPPTPCDASNVGISENPSDGAPAAAAQGVMTLNESSERSQPWTTGALPRQLPAQSDSEPMRGAPPLNPRDVLVAEESQRLIAELRSRLNEQASQLQHAETVQLKTQGLLHLMTSGIRDPDQTTRRMHIPSFAACCTQNEARC